MATSSKKRKPPRKSTPPRAEELRFAIGQSSPGLILVASSARGVVSIARGEDPGQLLGDLQFRFPEAHLFPGDREDRSLVKQIVRFFASPIHELDLPLDIRGTPFQKRVWRAVSKIPAGTPSTYKNIALTIGAPKAMRAVGTACAHCDLFPAIPCHRVLRSDGSLAGGPWQAILLRLESDAISQSKPISAAS